VCEYVCECVCVLVETMCCSPSTATPAVLTELKAPKQVRFADHQESDGLRVEWTRPSCTETGYIRNFLVVYCLDDQCEGEARLCVLYIVLKT